jgi:serine/threonine protein phosphatase PrpC
MNNQNFNERLQISLGNKSDVGKVRSKNEDYMESFKCGFGDVFIVCDGMGGHIGGEVASRLAVFTAKEYITENTKGLKDITQLITEALNTANLALHNKTKENPDLTGMGTTCVILILNNENAYYGNVGDSRLYLIRSKNIYQLTKDQSFVQELVDQGIISSEEAENHPRKNEILQALGVNQKIEPQLNPGGLKTYKNDKFLLCSDGLSGMVKDIDILDIVNHASAMDACEKLVNFANMNGGIDNITVQIAHILNGEVLPDDLKDVPPPNSYIKTYKQAEETRIEATKEIRERIPVQEQSTSGTGSKKTLFFILGGIIVFLILIFAAWWVLLRNSNKSEEIKSNETIISEDKETKEYKTITEQLYSFFKNKLYRGKSLDEKLSAPPDIIFNNIKYKSDKDKESTVITFQQLKDDIRKRELWLTKDFEIISVKGSEYTYLMYIKIGDNNLVKYSLVVLKPDNDKLEIKEIAFYIPPEPVKEENRSIEKPKVNSTPQEKGQQKKEENNPIDNAKKEGEKIKEKVEEKIPDIKKEK